MGFRQRRAAPCCCSPRRAPGSLARSPAQGRPAQPSLRYLTLIREGAANYGLQPGYRAFLDTLQPYRAHTPGQRAGAYLFGAVAAVAIFPVWAGAPALRCRAAVPLCCCAAVLLCCCGSAEFVRQAASAEAAVSVHPPRGPTGPPGCRGSTGLHPQPPRRRRAPPAQVHGHGAGQQGRAGRLCGALHLAVLRRHPGPARAAAPRAGLRHDVAGPACRHRRRGEAGIAALALRRRERN